MNHYLLRLSPAVAALTTALFLSHTVGNSLNIDSEHGGSSAQQKAKGDSAAQGKVASPSAQNNKKSLSASDSDVAELMRSLESGERRHSAIQEMLSTIAGDSKPIRWNSDHIRGTYKLTQIISHLNNLDNNFEMVFIHTLPDRDHNEDLVTNYTNRVHESEIQNIRNSIVFSRLIVGKKDQVVFDEASRAQYFFSATSDSLAGTYSLRAPKGAYKIAPVGVNSFDPLSMLSTNSHVFDEIGEYQYEIVAGSATYNITIIPRITDIETLTLEVEIRELKSLETYTFVLVYEQL